MKIFPQLSISIILILSLATDLAADRPKTCNNVRFTLLTQSRVAEDTNLVQEAKDAIEKADSIMGDWQGTFKSKTKEWQIVARVMALGKAKYHASLFREFDKPDEPVASLDGQLAGDTFKFQGWGDGNSYIGPDWEGAITRGIFTGKTPGREGGTFEMHKVFRISPTLGQKPPLGAIVLFDGTDFNQWMSRKTEAVKWKLAEGYMEMVNGSGDITTRQKFANFKMHLEFREPFEPNAREQQRGNSGVLIGGTEIQVLENYGRRALLKECGAIYDQVAPLITMSAPPRQWQTYDVTFTSPDKDGNARLTVLLNGVKIHDNLIVGKASGSVSISLQDHSNPVQYRNIWLVSE